MVAPSERLACLKSGASIVDAPEKWNMLAFYKLFIYLGLCYVLALNTPDVIWDPELMRVTLVLGGIGIWRFSWWFVHLLRAELYGHIRYPLIRAQADEAWEKGWRPTHMHYLITTFHERRDTTELVLKSILQEARDTQLATTIWLGSGDKYDEDIMSQYLKLHGQDLNIELIIVRQNVAGKRMAIGLVLRAMSRHGIGKNDLVCFMDGDAILDHGVIQKCTSVFARDEKLQAITTNEEVLCFGPRWVATWLTMRFAQRRVAMQSHSLSNKVLTLTGRMSVFRAQHLTKLEFIRKLEADHLEHWLWGDFRFLSGDDKSSWYYMLTQDARMLYIPDAIVYTVEEIEGLGLARMTQNFWRWSGNMLRNGARALALGPRKVGFFIWWCILDQRIAMWTMLISPILAISASVVLDSAFIVGYITWIMFSRMLLSLFLYRYSRQIHISFPFILYANQILNAGVKVYCLFRLSKQRWSHRGNQSAGLEHNLALAVRTWIAFWVTIIWVSSLIVFALLYSGIFKLPSYLHFMAYFIG
ncbi:MAG: glycosyltransferase [Bermanella sp.]